METTEVIKRNRKKFDQTRRMVRMLLFMVLAMILIIQRNTIAGLFKLLFND